MRRSTFFAVTTAAVLAAGVASFHDLAHADVPIARRAPALDDATIVAIFDAANTFDIETGSLGAKRATNKDVKDYGKMLSQVHTQVRAKGRALAKKLGVRPTPPKDFQMAKDHKAAVAKLKGLKGAAFEKAFLEHERDYHAAVIQAVTTTLLPAIQNEELKDFVTSLAPAFEAHKLAAENLLKKLNYAAN